ncbi:hypothetical protein GGP77_002933 [Salinibacter ruber]|uniref:Uncharacterized protein n=1 Tax=Salinibacter ruber TaxID=146919 RepID=A0A9X2Z182_9BACT|nr:hypothetical protein [Salinibacter ruber]MCS3859570.1 hypothetical protein [Salinibacter ruber]MCS3866484.1 hypothetical protein [Salinibacter ruber]MCS4151768.1 hypothetical protein [Salinibacter ruber]MCS4177888.1 hypothetical protein [Salinibacter ruber]
MQARQLRIVGLAASRERARAVRRSVRGASLSRLDCATSGAEGGSFGYGSRTKGGFGLEMKRAGLLEIETEREKSPLSACGRHSRPNDSLSLSIWDTKTNKRARPNALRADRSPQ